MHAVIIFGLQSTLGFMHNFYIFIKLFTLSVVLKWVQANSADKKNDY